MYNYEWDIETGGYILLPSKITGVTKHIYHIDFLALYNKVLKEEFGPINIYLRIPQKIVNFRTNNISIYFEKITYNAIRLLYHFICNSGKLTTHQSGSINSDEVRCNHLT